MNKEELTNAFNQRASDYDKGWEQLSPVLHGLYHVLSSILSELPHDAKILCVGAGTGAELSYLAQKNPNWHFTAVDPSSAMLDICRQRAKIEGFYSRCSFYEGYLETLSSEGKYDAATALLVSHFIIEQQDRKKFFGEVANKLKPGGILTNADLSTGSSPHNYETLLDTWINITSGADTSNEDQKQIRDMYLNDVAVLPPLQVSSLIQSAGFELPVQFFQSGLIHAWFSKCAFRQAS